MQWIKVVLIGMLICGVFSFLVGRVITVSVTGDISKTIRASIPLIVGLLILLLLAMLVTTITHF